MFPVTIPCPCGNEEPLGAVGARRTREKEGVDSDSGASERNVEGELGEIEMYGEERLKLTLFRRVDLGSGLGAKRRRG